MYNLKTYKDKFPSSKNICRKPPVQYPQLRVVNSVLELIGNTPLVKLQKIPARFGIECDIYAKCEYFNPSGSVKDRVAYSMLNDAEKHGVRSHNTTLIEPTSGNTGIGVAFNATLKGYKCKIVTQQKNSDEKLNIMRLLGADVIQLRDDEPEIGTAQQIKDEDPKHHIMLDQFENDVNPRTHYELTGVEIYEALGPVDMVAMGAGTGGTITGVGTLLKEKNPHCIIVGAEPEGSIMMKPHAKSHPFLVEGIGGKVVPVEMNVDVIDVVETVTDQEAFTMSRKMAKLEGILCGGSSGVAMCAAINAAKKHGIGKGKKVVVILPDGIRNYMSKFVSDQWMEAYRFKSPPKHHMRWWTKPIADLCLRKIYPVIDEESTCEQAIAAMEESNIAIVIANSGNFLGAVTKDSLRKSATNPTLYPGHESEDFNFADKVTSHLMKDCHKLAVNVDKPSPVTVGLLSRILDITPFVVLGKQDSATGCFKPTSVATPEDVFDYIYQFWDN